MVIDCECFLYWPGSLSEDGVFVLLPLASPPCWLFSENILFLLLEVEVRPGTLLSLCCSQVQLKKQC